MTREEKVLAAKNSVVVKEHLTTFLNEHVPADFKEKTKDPKELFYRLAMIMFLTEEVMEDLKGLVDHEHVFVEIAESFVEEPRVEEVLETIIDMARLADQDDSECICGMCPPVARPDGGVVENRPEAKTENTVRPAAQGDLVNKVRPEGPVNKEVVDVITHLTNMFGIPENVVRQRIAEGREQAKKVTDFGATTMSDILAKIAEAAPHLAKKGKIIVGSRSDIPTSFMESLKGLGMEIVQVSKEEAERLIKEGK